MILTRTFSSKCNKMIHRDIMPAAVGKAKLLKVKEQKYLPAHKKRERGITHALRIKAKDSGNYSMGSVSGMMPSQFSSVTIARIRWRYGMLA